MRTNLLSHTEADSPAVAFPFFTTSPLTLFRGTNTGNQPFFVLGSALGCSMMCTLFGASLLNCEESLSSIAIKTWLGGTVVGLFFTLLENLMITSSKDTSKMIGLTATTISIVFAYALGNVISHSIEHEEKISDKESYTLGITGASPFLVLGLLMFCCSKLFSQPESDENPERLDRGPQV